VKGPARPDRTGNWLIGTLAHRVSVQAPHRPPHPGLVISQKGGAFADDRFQSKASID
jgi:hypothetical protein